MTRASHAASPAGTANTANPADTASTTLGPAVLRGTVQAPPSKSETHRAFVLGALSATTCDIVDPLRAADPHATLGCLTALGAHWSPTARGVRFEPRHLRAPTRALDCANSGTTLRLLAAQCARYGWPATLDGDASLRSRPNRSLRAALQALGAAVDGEQAPLRVQGPLRPGAVELDALASSQPVSALLLVLPLLDGPSTVVVRGALPSAGYVDVTTHTARAFGLRWDREDASGATTWRIPGGQAPRAGTVRIGGDWSSAAHWLVGAALTGGAVRVTGLEARSPQADRAIVGLVARFGASARLLEDGASVSADAPLASPGELDVASHPDLFPLLAVLAARSRGTTRFTGIGGLRGKESDRVATTVAGLRALGIAASDDGASCSVTGGAIGAGQVDARGDHRIHMAFLLAGCAATGPVTVTDPDSVAVSYPAFHGELRRLTGASA